MSYSNFLIVRSWNKITTRLTNNRCGFVQVFCDGKSGSRNSYPQNNDDCDHQNS